MEAEIGAGERNRRQAHALGLVLKILRGSAHQNVVPINLQIGRDANLLRARRQFSAEVHGHGARTAGGEAHIVDHTHPLAVCLERFDRGRDRLYTGLPRGVHAVSRKVFHFAMQQQP